MSDLCRLQGFNLLPRPLRKPHPPIYVGGTVDAAIRRAARLGDELIVSTTQRIGDIRRVLDVYENGLRSVGKRAEAATPVLNRMVHVLPDGVSKDDAVAFFAKAFLELYDAWGHQNVTGLESGARSLEQVDADHFIIGDASTCVDAIRRYQALGIKEIACLMNFGNPDPDAVERSMRLFAEKVMPHVA